MIRNIKTLSGILMIAVFLVFLDAYVIFGIPVSWVGQFLLFSLAITQITSFKDSLSSSLIVSLSILLFLPQIYLDVFDSRAEFDYIYISLRYLNIASFFIVFTFIVNLDKSYKFNHDNILNYFKKFCFLYSALVIYIFLAQIFDLYEPLRNRANTDLFRDSSQSTFWLSQPHRAMGTFREPSFLITFFYPIVLLVTKSFKDNNILFSIVTGVALGLTRSDYVRFFSILIFLILIYLTFKDKKLNLNFSFLLISILFFSTFGVLECNLNPSSVECREFQDDVEKINGSGKIQIKSNDVSSVVNIGRERLNVLNYFFTSLENLNPKGLSRVNQNFQIKTSTEISNEMYFTNRTVPEYLHTRFSTQNFGTGSYSILKYQINVQNVIVFYTTGFGAIFLVLIFVLFIDFITRHIFSTNVLFFLMILLFFSISPIEELNAYYGLVIGLSYNILIKEQTYEKV
jgi:hypothetical protein